MRDRMLSTYLSCPKIEHKLSIPPHVNIVTWEWYYLNLLVEVTKTPNSHKLKLPLQRNAILGSTKISGVKETYWYSIVGVLAKRVWAEQWNIDHHKNLYTSFPLILSVSLLNEFGQSNMQTITKTYTPVYPWTQNRKPKLSPKHRCIVTANGKWGFVLGTWFIQLICRTCKKRFKVSMRSKVRG